MCVCEEEAVVSLHHNGGLETRVFAYEYLLLYVVIKAMYVV